MAGRPVILVSIFLSLSLHLTTNAAFLFDSRGIVRPKNPYGFIGETLTLTCNVTDPSISGNVSGGMYFTKQFDDAERVLPLKHVRILSTRSIRLLYPVKSGDYQGSYTCHLNTTEGTELVLGSQYVTVDYRPSPVDKIDCHVYNWETLTCNWNLGQEYNNRDRVKVQLVWAILDGQYDCPHQNLTSCVWKVHDGKDSFQAGKTYYMSVIVMTHDKNWKKVDEAQSNVFSIDTKLIVKPAPVHDLTVVNKTSTCISLSWNHTKRFRMMLYRLHVWQKDQLQEYNSIQGKSKTVCGLHPARDYVLQVSCIPVPVGYTKPQGAYSDWTSIVQRTLEDVPSGVPELTVGSFRYDECPMTSKCMVTIYWKPMSENACNGEITHYMVTQTDTQSGDKQTFEVKGAYRSMELGVRKDREYLIQLKARTRVGYSSKSSTILIQPLQYRLPYPSDFLVEAHENTLHITWGPPKESQDTPRGRNIGYTLYYCNGSKFTFRCLDEIMWFPLSNDDRSFKWEVLNDTLDNKMIGISSEMEIANQKVSSGIEWNLCTYQQNRRPPKPRNVRFSPEQPDNTLRVEWEKFDCAIHPIYITQYIISYCPLNSQGGCAGPSVNQTVPNTEVSHLIKDLKTGVSYRVTMFAVSKAGAGPESDSIVMEVTNSDLNTGEIVGVIFACLFVFILIVIMVILLCKKVRKIKKGFYMDVDIPSLPPLREADPLQDLQHHYPGRPLPQPPTSHTATGPDDGYSSADTDPTFDPTRYEHVGTKGKNHNDTNKRNVSVSSETALLLYMEENYHNEDHGKCRPYQVTQLSTIHSAGSLGSDRSSSQGSKRYRTKPNPKADNSSGMSSTSGREDNSVDSYLKVGNSTDSPCHSSSSASSGRPLLDSNTSQPRVQHRIPHQEAQIGFVLMPPPLSDPPPPPAPPPTRQDIPLQVVSPCPPSDNISYVTDTAFQRQYNNTDPTLETGLYSKIGSDGSSSPAHNPGYILHDQLLSPEPSLTPTMTSTPHGDPPSVRPLSEYMKHLPLSYYEEPHSDQEQGPTTEL